MADATTLQIRRGPDSVMATFVGKLGEITYNTTTHRIHMHDGTTAGGYATALLTDIQAGGDMMVATYDPTGKAADAFSMANMVETVTHKVMTGAERTKLGGIADGADKTPDLSGFETKTDAGNTYAPKQHTHTTAQVTGLDTKIETLETAIGKKQDKDANLDFGTLA